MKLSAAPQRDGSRSLPGDSAVLAKPREPSPPANTHFFRKFMSFQSVMSCNAKPSRVLSSWWSGFADRFSGGYGAQTAGLGGEVMEAGGFTLWSFCGRAAREKAGKGAGWGMQRAGSAAGSAKIHP